MTLARYLALPRPAIFGHRGVRGAAPENTLAAMRLAAEQGADGVEIDVRPCKSGELVVFHDATLERLAGDPRRVADLPLAELGAVRVGGEPIPTLAEVLSLCRERGLALDVELKRDVPSRPAAVVAAARQLGRADIGAALFVSSFDPLMLAGFRALARAVPAALLVEPDHQRWRLGDAAHLLGTGVNPHHSMVTAERLARWHRHGLRVIAWTVNSSDELRRLTDLGIDGFIADDPAGARAAIASSTRR